MDLFETILMNIIFISFPLVFCLLYQSYNETLNKEKNDLFLDIALFSSFYLILRFGIKISIEIPQLLFNIPLIIAYTKNRKTDIVLLSICIIIYYAYYLEIPWIFSTVEYTLYFIIYKINRKRNSKLEYFTNIMLGIKSICLTFFLLHALDSIKTSIYHIIILFSFFVITKFTIYLLERAEDILSLRLKIKEFEKEKNLRESLFKITHEIKNPIAVCKGYLDMFDINNQEHSRKYIPILKDEVARVLILLEDFLSINKIKIEKDIMDINLLLENIYHNFVPILEDRNIEAKFNIQEDELFIMGDYNRLSQVLINIIKNSIEAIPEHKKGTIQVSIEETKNEVKIMIEDNGKGMGKEALQKIKEPFFTTKEKGSGLGIYLSDEIIRGHNGTITYHSKEGEGTTVTVAFPKGEYKTMVG